MPTPTKKQSLELPLFRLDDFQLPVLLVDGWCSRIRKNTLKCDCISISSHVQPSSTESYPTFMLQLSNEAYPWIRCDYMPVFQ